MLKSTMDKIKTGFCALYYNCDCCMDKKDKPRIRRELRRKAKQRLQKEIKQEL